MPRIHQGHMKTLSEGRTSFSTLHPYSGDHDLLILPRGSLVEYMVPPTDAVQLATSSRPFTFILWTKNAPGSQLHQWVCRVWRPEIGGFGRPFAESPTINQLHIQGFLSIHWLGEAICSWLSPSKIWEFYCQWGDLLPHCDPLATKKYRHATTIGI